MSPPLTQPHYQTTSRRRVPSAVSTVPSADTEHSPGNISAPYASVHVRTTTQQWVDSRGHGWYFEVDIISPARSDVSAGYTGGTLPHITLMNIPGGVDFDRRYWDRFFDELDCSSHLRANPVVSLDYVGTGVS